MSKGHHYTGISQGGRLAGISSFPEKYPPCFSDLRAANSPHTAWDRGATEIKRDSRTQGDDTQLPYSRFFVLTPGRSFRKGAGEVATASKQGPAVRVLWPPLCCAGIGADPYSVHINVYIGTSAICFPGLFSSQIL